MAYDEDLANRIRELVGGEAGVTEKKMFGGLAFLIGGNMARECERTRAECCCVSTRRDRQLVEKPHAEPFVMRGRGMQGWLRVDPAGVTTKRELQRWVARGVAYARSLPAEGRLDRRVARGQVEPHVVEHQRVGRASRTRSRNGSCSSSGAIEVPDQADRADEGKQHREGSTERGSSQQLTSVKPARSSRAAVSSAVA